MSYRVPRPISSQQTHTCPGRCASSTCARARASCSSTPSRPRSSFEEISTFHQQILRVKDQDWFPIVVVANKCDLEYERQVGMNGALCLVPTQCHLAHAHAEGRDLAKHFGCVFIETSAKQRINVDQAFTSLVREIRKYNKVRSHPSPSDTSYSRPPSKNRAKTCRRAAAAAHPRSSAARTRHPAAAVVAASYCNPLPRVFLVFRLCLPPF